MDKEKKWFDIHIDGEDIRAIGYNYDSLEDSTSNSDESFEDYLIIAYESWILEEEKKKLEAIENDIQLIWLLYWYRFKEIKR